MGTPATAMYQRHRYRYTLYTGLHQCEEATAKSKALTVRIIGYSLLVISTASISEKRPPAGHRGSRVPQDPA
jgi:hypothetical protein